LHTKDFWLQLKQVEDPILQKAIEQVWFGKRLDYDEKNVLLKALLQE